ISLLYARDARQSARLARSQAYQARLAAAIAALSGNDVADTARHLERAPKELRGWEWRHLHSRLDDSYDRIVAAPGASFFLLNRPDEIQVAQVLPDARLRLTDLDDQHPRTISFSATAGSIGQLLQGIGGVRFMEWGKNDTLHLWDEAAAPRFR